MPSSNTIEKVCRDFSSLAALLCLCVWLSPGCGSSSQSGDGAGDDSDTETEEQAIEFVRVLSGLSRPSFVTSPPGDAGRLFIVERQDLPSTEARIRIASLPDNTLLPAPFLTVAQVGTGAEQGLLGLAFHPNYEGNGFFFIHYTDGAGSTVVERYQRSAANPDLADPGSGELILRLVQPQPNHNGGWLGFGPDGYLYLCLGDGGGGNDNGLNHTPDVGNSQDITDNLLGAVLRIDVDGGDAYPSDDDRNYAIPASNPFVGKDGDDEIWAYGLRNPWRASFDRATGDFYVGDVGQNNWEELNYQPASSEGGANYGWRLREGIVSTPTPVPPGTPVGGARPEGAIDPIYVHRNRNGTSNCSITGGYVYRGPIESLDGHYFFADFCAAKITSLRFDGSDPEEFDGSNFNELRDRSADPGFIPTEGRLDRVVSFGEDTAGNLYVIDHDGDIFRLQLAVDEE